MIKRLLPAYLVISALMLFGCAGARGPEGPVGPAGVPGPIGPQGPAGEDATASQQYIGSEECGDCHAEQYARFVNSGHPYKLTKLEGDGPPSFPYDSQTGGVQEPPDGYTWADISYVIGGFGWKVRFMDKQGYIITGDSAEATTQYNFANEAVDAPAGWVGYHPGEQKPYDCGACHTTGYRPQGHQDNLEGIVGTWAFPGIQCEACHGPGSRHAEDPYGVQMVLDRSSQLCGNCHVRGNPAQINGQGGFERHHQQYEDLFNSKHFAISCVTCHDPHASSLFEDAETNPNKGIRQTCTACHWQNVTQKNRKHFSLDCLDCHMPYMAKSAQGDLSIFTADVRSHQFSINPDPEAPQFSEDGSQVMPYINLEYACKHCHNGSYFSDQDLTTLADMARDYHVRPTPTPPPTETPEPETEATATPAGP